MDNVCKIAICILAGVVLASCYCPPDEVSFRGKCSFCITCFGSIEGFSLPKRCQESINYPIAIQVTLHDAITRLTQHTDWKMMSMITDLKISGSWHNSSILLLHNTVRLKSLDISNMNIETNLEEAFTNLYSLEHLNLAQNKLSDINGIFQVNPNKIKTLSLAYNDIENISYDTFESLVFLEDLDLSNNLISDLTQEPFCNLTNLNILRLNNNRIKYLNGALNTLHKLKHLYIRGNQIDDFNDESLKIIEHLETFDVSSNQLEEIKPDMFLRHWNHFGNVSLCKIIVSNNYIYNVPQGTLKEIASRYEGNLDDLHKDIQTELDLSGNVITNVEYNAFQHMVRLVHINLSKNKLIDFNVNPKHLVHVKYLNLSSNLISSLYFDTFSLMYNLQMFDLSNNTMEVIPDMTFNNIRNLKLLNLTYNDIHGFDSIHITIFHSKGGVLDLSNNDLNTLRIPYGEGVHLITLKLQSNDISDPELIDLRQQNNLENLYMSYNSISELDMASFNLPDSLVFLDLSYNTLERLGPSSFHSLHRLKTLYLNHNYLNDFVYGAFEGLSTLEDLDLSFNKISYLDSKYFTDLKSLQMLSLKSNDMVYLDYKGWYGHHYNVMVYIDNNNFTCDWLGEALKDFHNEFSPMQPTVLHQTTDEHSVEGIPCIPDTSAATKQNAPVDDRLLIITQKILNAVREQNDFLKLFLEKARKET